MEAVLFGFILLFVINWLVFNAVIPALAGFFAALGALIATAIKIGLATAIVLGIVHWYKGRRSG